MQMRLLSQRKFKKVHIHGITLSVPEGMKYIAVDQSGLIQAFVNEPGFLKVWGGVGIWEDPDAGDAMVLGEVQLIDIDWTDALFTVPDEPSWKNYPVFASESHFRQGSTDGHFAHSHVRIGFPNIGSVYRVNDKGELSFQYWYSDN